MLHDASSWYSPQWVSCRQAWEGGEAAAGCLQSWEEGDY